MCDASYVVRRTSRQTHDISYLTYVRSYDKVARSTIFSHQNKFGSIDRTLGGRQPYPARASFGTVDIVFKPRVSAFQNCPQRYMRHNIARDIALATKLVILWTGISVYTPIPVKRSRRLCHDLLVGCCGLPSVAPQEPGCCRRRWRLPLLPGLPGVKGSPVSDVGTH